MATDVPPGLIHQFKCLEDCVCLEIYWIEDLNPNDIERHSNGGMSMEDSKQREEAPHIRGLGANRVVLDEKAEFPLKGQQDFLVMPKGYEEYESKYPTGLIDKVFEEVDKEDDRCPTCNRKRKNK